MSKSEWNVSWLCQLRWEDLPTMGGTNPTLQEWRSEMSDGLHAVVTPCSILDRM